MPQWLPVSLAYLSCSCKWFGPAADQPQRARKAGENFDNDSDSDIFLLYTVNKAARLLVVRSEWMLINLSQNNLVRTFKGYLVECPFLTTNSTMNITVMPGFQPPVKHLSVLSEASGKSQCPSTCMFSLFSQIPPQNMIKKRYRWMAFPLWNMSSSDRFLQLAS